MAGQPHYRRSLSDGAVAPAGVTYAPSGSPYFIDVMKLVVDVSRFRYLCAKVLHEAPGDALVQTATTATH